MDEEEEKIAVAATFGMSAVFKSPRSPAKAIQVRRDDDENTL